MINKIEQAFDDVKTGFQKLFRGYSHYDQWEYCSEFLKREYKPFCAFYEYKKENCISHPTSVSSFKEWFLILDEIKFAFDFHAMNDGLIEEAPGFLDNESYWENYERAQKGLELYGKHLMSMWD